MCADIEQCERTDTWFKANYDSTRSRSGVRTERLRSPALTRTRARASSSVSLRAHCHLLRCRGRSWHSSCASRFYRL